jgi:ribosomal protein L33
LSAESNHAYYTSKSNAATSAMELQMKQFELKLKKHEEDKK